MLWPTLSCNPSLCMAGCRGQTVPSCTSTSHTIYYIHTPYNKAAPSCNNRSYAGCRGHTAPSCTTLLTKHIHMLWPRALSCNSVRQCAWWCMTVRAAMSGCAAAVRQCAAVCCSAAVSVRPRGSVGEAVRQCATVQPCAAVCSNAAVCCSAAVCGNATVCGSAAVSVRQLGSVRQCAAVRQYDSVRQCATV
jgi:hypothetical protein